MCVKVDVLILNTIPSLLTSLKSAIAISARTWKFQVTLFRRLPYIGFQLNCPLPHTLQIRKCNLYLQSKYTLKGFLHVRKTSFNTNKIDVFKSSVRTAWSEFSRFYSFTLTFYNFPVFLTKKHSLSPESTVTTRETSENLKMIK